MTRNETDRMNKRVKFIARYPHPGSGDEEDASWRYAGAIRAGAKPGCR